MKSPPKRRTNFQREKKIQADTGGQPKPVSLVLEMSTVLLDGYETTPVLFQKTTLVSEAMESTIETRMWTER